MVSQMENKMSPYVFQLQGDSSSSVIGLLDEILKTLIGK